MTQNFSAISLVVDGPATGGTGNPLGHLLYRSRAPPSSGIVKAWDIYILYRLAAYALTFVRNDNHHFVKK